MTHLWCAANYGLGATPTTKEAQAIADELYADFVSEEVDKVEMIYTKFVSLISSDPVVQTLLPLTPQVGSPASLIVRPPPSSL
jgi:F0F1-type ATP synthase gamma subunit